MLKYLFFALLRHFQGLFTYAQNGKAKNSNKWLKIGISEVFYMSDYLYYRPRF